MNAPIWKTVSTEISSIKIGQYEVQYRVVGDGPPVVCSELPLNAFARFHLLQEKLAEKYRAFLIDLRPVIGFTPKAPPADDLLEFLSEFSLKVLDTLGVHEFSLIGSFMYGGVSMNMALAAPDRVRDLVLIGTTGLAHFPQTLQLRFVTTIYRFPGVPFLNRSWLFRHGAEAFDYYFFAPTRVKQIFYDPEAAPVCLEDLYEQNKTPEDPSAAWTLMWAIRKINYKKLVPRIPQIKCPTLIVHGADDVWIPVHYAEELQSLIPNSKLVVIPQTRHAPEAENVDLTFQHIEKFLEEQETTLASRP